MKLSNFATSAGVCLVLLLIMQNSTSATPLEEWMTKLNDKSAKARRFSVKVLKRDYTAAIEDGESLESGTKIKIPYRLAGTGFRQDIMLTATDAYGAFFMSEDVAKDIAMKLIGVDDSVDVRIAAKEVIKKLAILTGVDKDERLKGEPHWYNWHGAIISMGMEKNPP